MKHDFVVLDVSEQIKKLKRALYSARARAREWKRAALHQRQVNKASLDILSEVRAQRDFLLHRCNQLEQQYNYLESVAARQLQAQLYQQALSNQLAQQAQSQQYQQAQFQQNQQAQAQAQAQGYVNPLAQTDWPHCTCIPGRSGLLTGIPGRSGLLTGLPGRSGLLTGLIR